MNKKLFLQTSIVAGILLASFSAFADTCSAVDSSLRAAIEARTKQPAANVAICGISNSRALPANPGYIETDVKFVQSGDPKMCSNKEEAAMVTKITVKGSCKADQPAKPKKPAKKK